MELSRLAASGFRRIIQVLGSQMLRHLINAERETNSPSRTVARKRQVAKKKRDANSCAKAAINSNKSDKVEGVRAECDMDCIKGYDWDALIKLGI